MENSWLPITITMAIVIAAVLLIAGVAAGISALLRKHRAGEIDLNKLAIAALIAFSYSAWMPLYPPQSPSDR